MLTLGIDPGTARTGYGLVREHPDGRLELVACGVVATAAATPMPERLQSLHAALCTLIAEHRPESGAVETLFFQRNVSSALSVGQARGVALLALAQSGIPVWEYSPRQVKQAVAAYGGAGKRQMQAMVRTLLALAGPAPPDDAADALAVAICHLHSSRLQARAEAGG